MSGMYGQNNNTNPLRASSSHVMTGEMKILYSGNWGKTTKKEKVNSNTASTG